jgi:hypothetical protein
MVEPFIDQISPAGWGDEQAARPHAQPKIIQRVANKSIGNGMRVLGNMGTKGFN